MAYGMVFCINPDSGVKCERYCANAYILANQGSAISRNAYSSSLRVSTRPDRNEFPAVPGLIPRKWFPGVAAGPNAGLLKFPLVHLPFYLRANVFRERTGAARESKPHLKYSVPGGAGQRLAGLN